MAVDFTRGLVPLDTSPLMKVFAMNEQRKILAEDRARQQRIDAMNETTATLNQRMLRARLAELESKEPDKLINYVNGGTNMFMGLEVAAHAADAEAGPNPQVEAMIESGYRQALPAVEGTPLQKELDDVWDLYRTGDTEGAQGKLTALSSSLNVGKQFMDSVLARQDFANTMSGQEEVDTQAERHIAALTQILIDEGNPPELAATMAREAVAGTRNVQLSQSGQLAITDDLRGTGELITQPADTTPAPDIPQDMTMWEAAKAGTGGKSAAIALWNKTGGQIFSGTVNELTEQARQDLRSQQTGIIRAFALNSRYTGPQIDLIREEINISPEFFDSATLMHNRMISIDRNMAIRERELIQFLNDTSIPETQKSEDRVLLRSIMGFREQLGVPSVTTVQGLTPEAIDSMSDDELVEAVQFIGTDIQHAPKEIMEILLQRRIN